MVFVFSGSAVVAAGLSNPPTPEGVRVRKKGGATRESTYKEGVRGPGAGDAVGSNGSPAGVRFPRARSLQLAPGLSRERDGKLWTSEDSRSTLRGAPGEGFRHSMVSFWGARTPPNLRFRSKENGIRTPIHIFPESIL